MKLLESRSIVEDLKRDLKKRRDEYPGPLRLAIVNVGQHSVSEKFIALKEACAEEIGIETRRYELSASLSTNELRKRMSDIVHEPANSGVIIQLPLPENIDTQSILNTIVPEKDVDALAARSVGNVQVGKSKIVPPVAGAIDRLFQSYHIEVKGKRAVVLGYGRLVGQPVAAFLLSRGAQVTVLGDESLYDADLIRAADIVVSGVGKPNLICGDDVKEGAVVVDVGTSESGGVIVGDVDFESVSGKAAYMTPRRGGVGPLTVVLIFHNMLALNGA